MRRRTVLGAIGSGILGLSGCFGIGGDGGGGTTVVETTVSGAGQFFEFEASEGETIEVVVETLAGQETAIDLVDPENVAIVDGVRVSDERTITRSVQHPGAHELSVFPDRRSRVSVVVR